MEAPTEPLEKLPGRCWPLGGYAPGNYTCQCVSCGKLHEADKRASQCLVCAVSDAHAKIARVESALEFYAKAWVDEFSFLGTEPIGKEPSDALLADEGERARTALTQA